MRFPASESENRTHGAKKDCAESILRLFQQNRPEASVIATQRYFRCWAETVAKGLLQQYRAKSGLGRMGLARSAYGHSSHAGICMGNDPLGAERFWLSAYVCFDHSRVGKHLFRRSRRQFFAVMQHEDAIGEITNELHVVLDPEDRWRELMSYP